MPKVFDDITKDSKEVLIYLLEHPGTSIREAHTVLASERSYTATANDIKKLRKEGKVVKRYQIDRASMGYSIHYRIGIIINYSFIYQKLESKGEEEQEIKEAEVLGKLVRKLVKVFKKKNIDAIITNAVIELGASVDMLIDIWTFSEYALSIVETIRSQPEVANTQTFQIVYLWSIGDTLEGI